MERFNNLICHHVKGYATIFSMENVIKMVKCIVPKQKNIFGDMLSLDFILHLFTDLL